MNRGEWDERFSQSGYAYGTEPNAFLAEVAARIPDGPVLALADGQGRNGVHLATLGHAVTSVDLSPVGLEKARRLAEAKGVRVETVEADLATFAIAEGAWAGIVSIFAHLPREIRAPLHARAVRGLRPGGVFVLEAYSPAQIHRDTGGPKDLALLMPLDGVMAELGGLDWEIARETERDVVEGRYHSGTASVVQLLGRKPAAGR